ncbi:hypothetical protein ACLOJK_002398 [Asimina triloba]
MRIRHFNPRTSDDAAGGTHFPRDPIQLPIEIGIALNAKAVCKISDTTQSRVRPNARHAVRGELHATFGGGHLEWSSAQLQIVDCVGVPNP